ncbi:YxcD family protein [Paenibacillus sp. Marseille-P2973]|uniref:YxcD family protein n=1 Tax=Paenibacillus TaxID=44249 RepID=UPI001B3865DC|nr:MULTISPECIES: YxcD family protein [Paenibacillus]MBQ4897566.1 YxcD family protein [Paenibacillus sp. Marseille-P2973]MDN4069848.1 YxcD family protein [Paenibacillus vini]
MVLSMDEIINAICIHTAERTGLRPTDVQVELSWDEDTGYTGELWAGGRSRYIVESNILEAIMQYVYKEYGIRAFRDDITLDLDEEITAFVRQ